uniref:Serine aminopeptidase S33 domain-containing protein n=1 Tax=Aplanochytrium stocchinoi TaxID=215587 RepID=A0A6S8BXN8_9STRA|mmetsp:Transcript_21088/g.25651  ORF Transcript_21088/g.25651 Transcript_21088/m.25651 type:complete len:514 (+) Transcript_21088:156-1697(+)|eukprot:CAMPEP_0204830180 /NCGR_PEP_ID=MMETSP1346-20131115/8380_1 /ASSEMBLY_ACC=CAM_ASM_000771 /TAXON_ID=215587 /ORGANISM="Aplanochytrium stocchinoi, Strain GSBS06" /LENGTH=513 /DNA_ID=CAMNT_0051960329 /DNA_START=69 /DNA_END=1610 /DNA_ORIENTATION=-
MSTTASIPIAVLAEIRGRKYSLKSKLRRGSQLKDRSSELSRSLFVLPKCHKRLGIAAAVLGETDHEVAEHDDYLLSEDNTEPEDPLIISGIINGAKFKIAEPTKVDWNRGIIIYAHGFRPKGHGLVVELNAQPGSCYHRLVSEGWLVAATSYRRDGVIILDAMRDIINLRDFIVKRYGQEPTKVIVEGQSMGGAIATLLAENSPEKIDGVVAVGAALNWRRDTFTDPKEKSIELNCFPQTPILYLTNTCEVGTIRKYISKCESNNSIGRKLDSDNPVEDDVNSGFQVQVPALWTVERDGHNWTNQEERYKALKSLICWLEFGTFITGRQRDGTIPSNPMPSTARFLKEANIAKSPSDTRITNGPKMRRDIGAEGTVLGIKSTGGILTSFARDDLFRLGIKLGSKFEVSINFKTALVTFDRYPFVRTRDGEWFATTEPENELVMLGIRSHFLHQRPADKFGRARSNDSVIIRLAPIQSRDGSGLRSGVVKSQLAALGEKLSGKFRFSPVAAKIN